MTCTGTLSGCTIPIAGTTSYKQLSGWSAGAGYDLATGLGSINVANLVTAWGNATQTATTTSLTLSATTFTHGTPVTVASTVTPASGTGVPSGSLALVATGTTSSPGPVLSSSLTAGAYSGSVTNLPGGTYAVTASYGGDASFSGSTSSPVNVTVVPEPSVMTASTLALSRFIILGRQPIVAATSAALNSQWFISISMAGTSGAGIPTGSITITQGTTNVGTFPLDNTGAIYLTCGPDTPCDFPIGNYTFTATYSGDSSFNKTSSTFPFAITKGTANFAVSANQQIVTTGTPVTATVYINYDPAVLPTGTVTLIRTDTNAALGTGTINSSGNAVITFNAPTGSYGASATWPGDTNYTAGFVSSYPDMTVTAPVGITTTSALKTSGATSSLGQRTSFSVTITPTSTPTNGAVPTGTVTLYSQEEGQIAAAVPIVGGNATLFVQWPVAGTETVYGVYSGDSNYAASDTGTSVVAVSQAMPILSLSSLAPYVLIGGRDSITATLSSTIASTSAPAPTGTIQFYDSLNGAAAVSLGNAQAVNTGNGSTIVATIAPTLAAGTHVITAVYSGDTNWTTATSITSVSIVSMNPDFSITGPSALTITAGQSATVALSTGSILGFATPAAISCGGTLPEGVVCGTTTITPGSTGSLSLTSVAPGTVNVGMNSRQKSFPWQAPSAVAMASLLFFCLPRWRRLVSLASLLLITLITAFGISGCANGSTATASEISITSANSKVASGASVTLNAQVSGGKNPTGTVTFYDGSTSIGTSSLSNSIGNLDISTLAVGTHSITASYSGDNNNAASKSSDVLNQTVTGTFNLTITASAGTVSHTAVVPVTLQ
jgi:hypothetical protein